MSNINCRLCFNDCHNENGINIFDDKLEVDLPQLIAKHLLIIVENKENVPNFPQMHATKICRMCFVHLLDFHYFFQLVEQKQQEQRLPSIKFETVAILDSETDNEEQSVLDFLDSISVISDGHFHIINEADGCGANGRPDCIANNATIELDTKENGGLVKIKTLEERIARDPVSLANKFTYDDSELDYAVDNVLETNGDQNKNHGNKTRKRKRTRKADCNSSSMKETIIKLRRRTKNIYDVVDGNGHLKSTASRNKTQQSQEISNTSGTDSNHSICRRKTKTSHIKRTRSDEITYKIISNNGQLKCDICWVKLKTFRDLVQHFHIKHIDLRPYVVCCDKRHYSPKVFANHILSHSNPELFKCEICGKVLGTQYSYRSHKRAKHSGKRKAFKCHICGKRLISAKYFGVHVSNHT